ncbi:MAG: hypothetical protein GX777_07480 [Fastidiosipila sp.]|nr:hypothetical protein [Fastidiosipila sp.]
MKKRLLTPTTVAIAIYVLYSLTDRFLVKIPMAAAISIVIFCIVLIVIGNLWTPKTSNSGNGGK